MSGVNKVILVGRLGSEPESKSVNDTTVTNFSVATSESWKDKNGEKQEKTEWTRVVAWGKTAELCAKYLNKGKQVYLEGKLQTRSWDDKEGNKRYTTEVMANNIQFLGSSSGDKPVNHAPSQSFESEEIPF